MVLLSSGNVNYSFQHKTMTAFRYCTDGKCYRIYLSFPSNIYSGMKCIEESIVRNMLHFRHLLSLKAQPSDNSVSCREPIPGPHANPFFIIQIHARKSRIRESTQPDHQIGIDMKTK